MADNKPFSQVLKEQIPITDYAERLGFTLVRRGRYLSLKEHDSVMIDPQRGAFWRNSRFQRGFSGGAGSVIDFAVEFGGAKDAREAMSLLSNLYGIHRETDRAQGVRSEPPRTQAARTQHRTAEPGTLALPERAGTNNAAFRYLLHERGIHRNVIRYFLAKDMLYQDARNNCVFKTDSFACVRSTGSTRFVGDVQGSDYNECFYFRGSNAAKKLIVTESVIDTMSVMSYLTLRGRKYTDYCYLALSGTNKLESVFYHLQKEGAALDTVILSLDNDEAGHKAVETIQATLSEQYPDITCSLAYPPNGKDWNDYIKTLDEQGREIKTEPEKHTFTVTKAVDGVDGIETLERYIATDENGEIAGTLTFRSVGESPPHISFIETAEGFRRQGVATLLLQTLQEDVYPREINFGMTTPEGTELLNAITEEWENPQGTAAKNEYDRLRQELDRLQTRLDELNAQADGTDYDSPEFEAIMPDLREAGERWQEVYDRTRDMERNGIEDVKTSFRYVRLPEWTAEREVDMAEVDLTKYPIEQIAAIDHMNNPERQGTGGVYRASTLFRGLMEQFAKERNEKGSRQLVGELYRLYDQAYTRANLMNASRGYSIFHNPNFREGNEDESRGLELVYQQSLDSFPVNEEAQREEAERIFERLNDGTMHPADYYGVSLMVGDVVVFHDDFSFAPGDFHAYRVSSFGFEQVDYLLTPEMIARMRMSQDVRNEARLWNTTMPFYLENGITVNGERAAYLANEFDPVFRMADIRRELGNALRNISDEMLTESLQREINSITRRYHDRTQYPDGSGWTADLKADLDKAISDAGREQIVIANAPCYVVDRWQNGADTYVLGQAQDDPNFYYVQAATGGRTVREYEFDHRPTRDEAQDTHIDQLSEEDIDRHEAEYGADGYRAFPGDAPEGAQYTAESVTDIAGKDYHFDEGTHERYYTFDCRINGVPATLTYMEYGNIENDNFRYSIHTDGEVDLWDVMEAGDLERLSNRLEEEAQFYHLNQRAQTARDMSDLHGVAYDYIEGDYNLTDSHRNLFHETVDSRAIFLMRERIAGADTRADLESERAFIVENISASVLSDESREILLRDVDIKGITQAAIQSINEDSNEYHGYDFDLNEATMRAGEEISKKYHDLSIFHENSDWQGALRQELDDLFNQADDRHEFVRTYASSFEDGTFQIEAPDGRRLDNVTLTEAGEKALCAVLDEARINLSDNTATERNNEEQARTLLNETVVRWNDENRENFVTHREDEIAVILPLSHIVNGELTAYTHFVRLTAPGESSSLPLFVGTESECQNVLRNLQQGTITLTEARNGYEQRAYMSARGLQSTRDEEQDGKLAVALESTEDFADPEIFPVRGGLRNVDVQNPDGTFGEAWSEDRYRIVKLNKITGGIEPLDLRVFDTREEALEALQGDSTLQEVSYDDLVYESSDRQSDFRELVNNAMQAAGYERDPYADTLSYNGGDGGQPLQFEGGYSEAYDWLDGVVFEDERGEAVEKILHPVRYEEQIREEALQGFIREYEGREENAGIALPDTLVEKMRRDMYHDFLNYGEIDARLRYVWKQTFDNGIADYEKDGDKPQGDIGRIAGISFREMGDFRMKPDLTNTVTADLLFLYPGEDRAHYGLKQAHLETYATEYGEYKELTIDGQIGNFAYVKTEDGQSLYSHAIEFSTFAGHARRILNESQTLADDRQNAELVLAETGLTEQHRNELFSALKSLMIQHGEYEIQNANTYEQLEGALTRLSTAEHFIYTRAGDEIPNALVEHFNKLESDKRLEFAEIAAEAPIMGVVRERYESTQGMEDGYINRIAIVQEADGFHNHFSYDEEKGKGAAGTGVFRTLADARQDVMAHFPDARAVRYYTRETQTDNYFFSIEANPHTTGENDAFFLQAYRDLGNGQAEPGEVLFLGTYEQCRELMGKAEQRRIETGTITPEEVRQMAQGEENHSVTMQAASLSDIPGYVVMSQFDRSGQSPRESIFLGLAANYDGGIYNNADNSLIRLSDNPKMFSFFTASPGWTESQQTMIDNGTFTKEDYAEYSTIRGALIDRFPDMGLKRFEIDIEREGSGVPFSANWETQEATHGEERGQEGYTMPENVYGKMYDERLDDSLTAEEWYTNARNNYIDSPDVLDAVQRLLQDEARIAGERGETDTAQTRTEQAERVGYMAARERAEADPQIDTSLYNVEQMKLDFMDGNNGGGLDSVEIREGLNLSVFCDRGEVIVSLQDFSDPNREGSGATSLSLDEFKGMTQKDFDVFVGELHGMGMEYTEQEKETEREAQKYEYVVTMSSGGGTVRDFTMFPTREEAEQFISDNNGVFRDENEFEWGLSIDEREIEPEKSIEYQVGQSFYVDGKRHEITRMDDWNVYIMDRTVQNPELRTVSREDFEALLRQDERNLTGNFEWVDRQGAQPEQPKQEAQPTPPTQPKQPEQPTQGLTHGEDGQETPKDKLSRQLLEGVASVMNSASYRSWLDTTSRLFTNNYSFANAMLIFAQKPEATYCMGYEAWKEYGRNVTQGAKGAKIFVPVIAYEKQDGALFRMIKKNLTEQLDKNPAVNPAAYKVGLSKMEFTLNQAGVWGLKLGGKEVETFGNEQQVKQFIQRNVLNKVPMYFTVGTVFDVKDVATPQFLWLKKGFTKDEMVRDDKGKPIKNSRGEYKIKNSEERINRFNTRLPHETVTKDPAKMAILLEALKAVAERNNVPVAEVAKADDQTLKGGAAGYYSRATGSITLDSGLEPTEKVAVLIHEMAHSDLHGDLAKLERQMGDKVPRQMREVQAESVAFSVAKHFGIETNTNSFSYVASWSRGTEMQDLKASLEVIYNETKKMTREIAAELDVRGLNLDLSEKEKAPMLEETKKDLAAAYMTRAVAAEERNGDALSEIKNTATQYADRRDILDNLSQQQGVVGEQRAAISEVKGLCERLLLSTDRAEQDAIVNQLDAGVKRIEAADTKIETLSAGFLQLCAEHNPGWYERFQQQPARAVEELSAAFPSMFEGLSATQKSYIALSEYVQKDLSPMLKEDTSGEKFAKAVTDRAGAIPQIAAKNGTFVEVRLCEQWTEQPIVKGGALLHPNVANSIIKQGEAQTGKLRREAEAKGDYFPYTKCNLSVFHIDKEAKALSCFQTRVDIGDGYQKSLTDFLHKEAGEKSELCQAFDVAIRERGAKEKMLYNEAPEAPAQEQEKSEGTEAARAETEEQGRAEDKLVTLAQAQDRIDSDRKEFGMEQSGDKGRETRQKEQEKE